jgi:thiol-disulfide isomerase/thioredoxin
MKQQITIFALICLFTLALSGQNNFTLEFSFDKAPTQTVTMETFNKGWFTKQTIPLANSMMSVSYELTQLEFFRVSFNPNVFIVIIALPGETVNISVNMENIFTSIQISGSPHTAFVYDQEIIQFQLQSKIDSLIAEFNGISNTLKSAELTSLYQSKIDSINQRKTDEMVVFLKSNTSSPAALFFIEKLDIGTYFELYSEIATNLNKAYPNHPIITNFYTKVETEKQTGIGAKVENIKLPGISGDSIALFPLKGKVVIIDFWASWCGPCRRENPHKVELYNKFKDKGLAYYSISLDNNGDGWKKAIIDDNLSWTDHVSELKGWGSVTSRKYGVASIPANIIINSEGVIIGKNLRGKQLEDLLIRRLDD